jgi:hypothetical protein|tara:strand:+ start:2067 stop:3194 length:1128 start_codon:yes stop_codon:yes gene_type:complete
MWILLKRTSLLLFITNLAIADIGLVTDYSGSAAIERDEGFEVYDVEDDLAVMMMDIVNTAKGKVRIEFIDDTLVDVTEHSRLLIDDFVYDPESGEGSLGLKASLGTVRYASGKIAKNSRQNVVITTPSAVIGVNGTDFAMIVNEIGGSMITLLPSCDTSGMCVVGEISVTTDIGFVIMNQAFQTTYADAMGTSPTKPVILDLDEEMMTNLLIIREVKELDPDGSLAAAAERKKLSDILGVDFLSSEALLSDELSVGKEERWRTALDDNAYFFRDLLPDILEQLNLALAKQLADDFNKTKKISQQGAGYDEVTGTRLNIDDGVWTLSRQDFETDQIWSLELDQNNGYVIDFIQQDFEWYDYRLGDGNNHITIKQRK